MGQTGYGWFGKTQQKKKPQTKTYPDKYCSALCSLGGRQEDTLGGEREKEG